MQQLYIDLDAQNQAKEAVVIDIRNNQGGFVNPYVIDVFARRGYLNMHERGFWKVPARSALGQRSLERTPVGLPVEVDHNRVRPQPVDEAPQEQRLRVGQDGERRHLGILRDRERSRGRAQAGADITSFQPHCECGSQAFGDPAQPSDRCLVALRAVRPEVYTA